MTRKNGRNADGTFAAGNPGKPSGSRHKATKAVEKLLQGEAEGLTRKVIQLALEGSVEALKICLTRISPPQRDAPVNFELSNETGAYSSTSMATKVLQAVATGYLSPTEANAVMKLIEAHVRIREFEELETRLTLIENRLES